MNSEPKIAKVARNTEHVALTINGIIGMRMIIKGIMLCRKKNKTEEEILAAKEFKRFMAEMMAMIAVFLGAVFIAVSMLISTLNGGSVLNSYITRNGRYVDGHVRYVQNTEKNATLEELGIPADQVEEGDRISLYFDMDENLLFGNTHKEENRKDAVALFMLLAVVVIFIAGVAVFAHTVRKSGKFAHFCRWYNQNV